MTTSPTQAKVTTATPGRALPGGDVLFGVQSVGFGVDRDVIRVGSEVGKFDRIRLRVLDNDIHLNEVKVIYSNGEPDTLGINSDLKQNSKTNWLELKGDRFIKEIQLNYRSKPNFKGQARVEVFGQFADGWLGSGGEGRKYNQGWVLLGAQTAGFVGFDSDTIPVGRNEGGFKKIRLTVKDRAITLKEVRVPYESGAEDVIPLQQHPHRRRLDIWTGRSQGCRRARHQGDPGEIPLAHLRQGRQRQGRCDRRDLGPALIPGFS